MFFLIYIFLPVILVIGFIIISIVYFTSKKRKQMELDKEDSIDFP